MAYNIALKRDEAGLAVIPESWKLNKTAGKDWLITFLARYPRLSLRKPEVLGIARAIAGNDTVLEKYVFIYIFHYIFLDYHFLRLYST